MQNLKLELEQKELMAKEKHQTDRINENNRKLRETEFALSEKIKERDAAIRERDAAINDLDGILNAGNDKIGDFFDRIDRLKKKRASELVQ